MQEATIEVESNLLAVERLKGKSERGLQGKKKVKEDTHPSTPKSTSVEDKLDDMTNLIKNLTSRLAKLDVGNRVPTRPVQEGMNKNPN